MFISNNETDSETPMLSFLTYFAVRKCS